MRIDRAARRRRAGLLLRVLPPQDRAGRAEPLRRARRAAHARALLRLGHLRRRRLHARQDDRDRQAHQGRLRPGGDGPLHLRRRHRPRAALHARGDGAPPASTTCSPCAAIPPPDRSDWVKTEGGLEFSRELVELIKSDYPFAIGAACFPETHIHATTSPGRRRATSPRRSRAGVDFLITQLFFDNSLYFDFVRPCPRRRHRKSRSSPASCPSRRSASSSA